MPKSTGAKRGTARSGALASVPRGLSATSILPESGDVRFVDVLLGTGFGSATAWWAASRPTGAQRFLWGLGLTLVGTVAGVEAKGTALKYGGIGTAAANGAVMLAEIAGLTKKGL